jgi:hypothetical protein
MGSWVQFYQINSEYSAFSNKLLGSAEPNNKYMLAPPLEVRYLI